MKTRIDMKSVIIGGMATVGLCLLARAAGSGGAPGPIGRFQIACTNTTCYLVDTATRTRSSHTTRARCSTRP